MIKSIRCTFLAPCELVTSSIQPLKASSDTSSSSSLSAPSISHPSIEPEPRELLSVPLLSKNQTAFCLELFRILLIDQLLFLSLLPSCYWKNNKDSCLINSILILEVLRGVHVFYIYDLNTTSISLVTLTFCLPQTLNLYRALAPSEKNKN
ncbi:hypothetical protein BpHYR1_049522 [Brachionus plicatilis]|uniref:Uncharacterized protein n=1 Tax=Brachionus plicatilis TaxID=10195 RepID=A0A3M7RE78_BRAPC|nr:hypothetical protein BpHYR1_049522 [Brachionus plicatilis]